jgi:hypothetical protein
MIAGGHVLAVADNLSVGKREYVPAGAHSNFYNIKSLQPAGLIHGWQPRVNRSQVMAQPAAAFPLGGKAWLTEGPPEDGYEAGQVMERHRANRLYPRGIWLVLPSP